MKKAFVFDMDGVLLDTESVCDRAWELTAGDFGLSREKAMEIISLCRGTNKKTSFEIISRSCGDDFDTEGFMAGTSKHFGEIEASEGIKAMPFAAECLSHLKEKGYRLALASSTRRLVVERQLKKAGLFDYFEVVVTGDVVANSKPDPEIYRTACERLGVAASDSVAVEDSLNGLKSAKAAGLTSIMVPDRVAPNAETDAVSDMVYASLKDVIANY